MYRRSVLKKRHVFFLHNPRDDTLVAVASGHFVTDGQLAFGGDIDLHRLDDAGLHAFTRLGAFHFLVILHLQIIELLFETADDFVDLVADGRRINLDAVINRRELAQERLGNLAIRRNDDFPGFGIDHVERNFFPEQNVAQRLGQLIAQFIGLFLVVVFNLLRVAFFLADG